MDCNFRSGVRYARHFDWRICFCKVIDIFWGLKKSLEKKICEKIIILIINFNFRCLSSLKSERVKASEVLKGPEVTTYDGDKKVFFLSYFVFLEFILTWDISQINETILCIFTDDAGSHIHSILIFRSFHAQDLIFTEFSMLGLPFLFHWFWPKMSNSLTKIQFLVLIANSVKIKSWARKWSKQLNIWQFFIDLRDFLYVKYVYEVCSNQSLFSRHLEGPKSGVPKVVPLIMHRVHRE